MYSLKTKQLLCEAFVRSEDAHNKYSLCTLLMELTRRCNLSCAHCYEGEAENLDMPFEYIDSIMSQVGLIYGLSLAGGEITLCLDRFRYVLDSAKRHNVRIKRMIVITNGVEKSTEFLEIYREFMEYVEMPHLCEIRISNDRYHSLSSKLSEADLEERKEFYSDHGKNKVLFQNVETILKRVGRCEKPPKIDYQRFRQDPEYKKYYINQTVAYTAGRNYPIMKRAIRHTGKHICQLFLSAKGYLLTSDLISYSDADRPEYYNGHITDSIKTILWRESRDPYMKTLGQYLIHTEDVSAISDQITHLCGFFNLGLIFAGRDKIQKIKELVVALNEIQKEMGVLLPDVKEQLEYLDPVIQNYMNTQIQKIDFHAFEEAYKRLEDLNI